MTYKSQAFEKQLKKHQAEQALKGIADLPDHRHRPQTRVTAPKPAAKLDGKPQIRSRDLEQIAREKPERRLIKPGQMLEVDGDAIVVITRKKPLYLRGWFVMLMFTIVSTALTPLLFKTQIAQMKAVAIGIKDNTGVDPLSMKTYTDMAKGKLTAPGVGAVVTPTTVQPVVAVPQTIGTTSEVVEQAQDRAMDVVKTGSDQSFRYIEEETARLNAMAKELDSRQGR